LSKNKAALMAHEMTKSEMNKTLNQLESEKVKLEQRVEKLEKDNQMMRVQLDTYEENSHLA
jgi:predicted  nucleic acid-binding Zn-ribbon protein